MAREVKVLKMSLRNFKGIERLDIDFGDRTKVFGDNATGKTTIFDAFLWCLFGKDSQNKADFDIKHLDGQGNAAHNLEHAVDVTLMVDGKQVLLTKIYQEKWTKKRGQAKPEFTGHTTEYLYDGVPQKEKEFQDQIKTLMDERIFRLLTDPRFFNEQLHWQDRRKILMEVCGEVKDADVIAANKSLAGLTAILNGHGIDDLKKIIASKRKEINDSLEKIPVRIDEATRSLVEIRPDIDTVPAQIEALEAQKQSLESRLADLRNGGAISAKRIELQNVIAEIQAKKNEHEQGKTARIAPLNKELQDLQDAERDIRSKRADIENQIQIKKSNISMDERTRERLRNEWNQIDAQESTDPTCCPYCKQALPESVIHEAREKFNKDKADKLAVISEQGKKVTAQIEFAQGYISAAEKDLESLTWKDTQERQEALSAQISAIRAEHPDLSDLEAKKAAIEKEITDIQATEQSSITAVQGEINETRRSIEFLQAELQKVKSNEAAQKRIEDLSAEEKRLSGEFEENEKKLSLVENFIRIKVGFLENRINKQFGLARFKLFADQINGGLSEVCETTMSGVPYSSVNNAGRIQAGMDIINTLQRHYGITAPIWIDNRESIVSLPPMGCQVVSLIVSEGDNKLRIEKEAA